MSVTGLIDAIEISAGNNHTCVRRVSGAVVCWDDNISGQLGDGTGTTRTTPVTVTGLTNSVEISGGYLSTCARTTGAVVCWGGGRLTPVPVAGL